MAAVECRSETATALTTDTFDSKQMNWAMLGEFVLAVLVTQMDVFNRLLGTVQINLREFAWPWCLPSRCWRYGSSVSSSPVVVWPPQAEADCSCCSWWCARQRDQPARAASPMTTSAITPISALVPAAPMRLATSSPRR